jgi:hypothetical protein
MNRAERRRHAARNRGRKTGYLHRLTGLNHLVAGKAGVFHPVIEHDDVCGIYRGADCDCVPDISVTVDSVVHDRRARRGER